MSSEIFENSFLKNGKLFKIFNFNTGPKNQIEDNNDKISNRFSDKVSLKSILRPFVFTETTRWRRS